MPGATPGSGEPNRRHVAAGTARRISLPKSAKQGLIRDDVANGEQRFRARQLTSQANAGVEAHATTPTDVTPVRWHLANVRERTRVWRFARGGYALARAHPWARLR